MPDWATWSQIALFALPCSNVCRKLGQMANIGVSQRLWGVITQWMQGHAVPKHGTLRPNGPSAQLRKGICQLQVAQAVIKQVAGRPCLLNLSRALALHKRTLSEEPLTLREAEQQQQLVNNLSDTLRTILCL